jgi:hypothetical protein
MFWILVLVKFSHMKIKILVQVCKSISIISRLTNTQNNVKCWTLCQPYHEKCDLSKTITINNMTINLEATWSIIIGFFLFAPNSPSPWSSRSFSPHFLSAYFHVCRDIKNYWQMEKKTTCLAQRDSWWWQWGEVVSPWSFGGTCSNFGRWKVHAWWWQGGGTLKICQNRKRTWVWTHVSRLFCYSVKNFLRHWYKISCQIFMRILWLFKK